MAVTRAAVIDAVNVGFGLAGIENPQDRGRPGLNRLVVRPVRLLRFAIVHGLLAPFSIN